MNRSARSARRSPVEKPFGVRAGIADRRWLPVVAALALAFSSAERAVANVSESGDVSPPFAPAAVVDLTGQRIFIGNTSGGVGGIGTVNVTAGGILTAAQIVPGTGGLGTGFVNVTGAGSTVHLTGGACVQRARRRQLGDRHRHGLRTADGSPARRWRRARSTSSATPPARRERWRSTAARSRGWGNSRSGWATLSRASARPAPTRRRRSRSPTAERCHRTASATVGANSGQTGRVTGNVTIDGAGSKWTIDRDLAGGGSQAGLILGAERQRRRQRHAQQRRQPDHHGLAFESGDGQLACRS